MGSLSGEMVGRGRSRDAVLIAAFDGEEIGAVGAHAVASKLWQQDPKPLVINVDRAGRVPDVVAIEATGPAVPLLAALDKAGRRHRIPLAVGSMPSDNRAFAARGFGSVGIGLGIYGMHSPADTADRVDSKAMVMAAKLIFEAAVEYLRAI